MDDINLSAEAPKASMTTVSERPHSVVFQPQKLKEVVGIIDLMGNIASRVREDNSGDLGGGGGGGGTQTGKGGAQGTSARDEAIAKAPPLPIMQKKLVQHLEGEVRALEKKAKKLRNTTSPGGAYLLNELYKNIRSLTALIARMLHASSAFIQRFYVSIFIDHQPITVSGSTLLGQDLE